MLVSGAGRSLGVPAIVAPSTVDEPMDLLTPKEAAVKARVSPSLIYTLCNEQRLPHYRIGTDGKRGRILIDPADLDRFIQECRQERHPLLASE